MSSPVNIRLNKAASLNVRRGHPWVYENSITHQNREGASGDVCVLYDSKRKFLAIGLFDPDSHLRVRLLSDERVPVDDAFFAAKILKAHAIRQPLLESGTDGYRLVHGENDFAGGLIIDRYANTYVVKLYSGVYFSYLDAITNALKSLGAERVILRLSRQVQTKHKREGELLLGDDESDLVVFKENHMVFEAHPFKGQKTGFFLDQRENRARVEGLSKDKRVLNVFSYNGGFSLYAARGGAKRVASVDLSPHAMASAARNFELNRSSFKCVHEEVVGDAFKVLEAMAHENRRFDVVIIDPPSFAKQQSEVEGALRSYKRLMRLGLKLLEREGELVFASCSSRIQKDVFEETLTQCAKSAGRPLRINEVTQHAIDHPILKGFREGAYLKCIFARA